MRNLSREMLIEAFPSSSVTAQLGPRASGFEVLGGSPFETRPYLGRIATEKPVVAMLLRPGNAPISIYSRALL